MKTARMQSLVNAASNFETVFIEMNLASLFHAMKSILYCLENSVKRGCNILESMIKYQVW